MHFYHRKPASLMLIGVLVLALSACGDQDGKASATQVAAKVGSQEISIHQINQILSRSDRAGATPEAIQALSREILEKLIDQQLAIDKALASKLDRTAETVAAIEAARRDILARAYMQKVVSAQVKPSPEEVHKYYAEHPQLFSERRIFNLQEIVLQAKPGVVEPLRAFAASGKSADEVAAWLKAKNIGFAGARTAKPAEQIALDLLPKVQLLKPGQSLFLATPQALTFLHLLAALAAPINETSAQARIEQFLTNQRASAAITAEIKQARANSKIVYMGEFAKASVPPNVSRAAAPTAPSASTNQAQSVIEKGVAGLK